jgi:hypothetical protein
MLLIYADGSRKLTETTEESFLSIIFSIASFGKFIPLKFPKCQPSAYMETSKLTVVASI